MQCKGHRSSCSVRKFVVVPAPNNIGAKARGVSSAKRLKITVDLFLFVPFLEEVRVQGGGSLDEITGSCAGSVVTMQLACNDTEFAL